MSSPMLALPTELTGMVASYLSTGDVWRFRKVCRQWMATFQGNNRLWQRVHVVLPSNRIPPEVERIISLSDPLPIYLRIRKIHDAHFDKAAYILTKCMGRIRHLELYFEYDEDSPIARLLASLVQPAPMLEHLALSCYDGPWSERGMTPLPPSMFEGAAPNLTHLTVDENFHITTDASAILASQITSLTLDPRGRTVQQITDAFVNVKTLHLIGDWISVAQSPQDDSNDYNWSRLDRLIITTAFELDDIFEDAFELAQFAFANGVSNVVLLVNEAVGDAVRHLQTRITCPTQLCLGRGGYSCGLQWCRRTYGWESMDAGVFVEFSTATASLRIGDCSRDFHYGPEIAQAVDFERLGGLTRLTLCESVVSELARASPSIELPCLTCLSVIIATISQRRTPQLFDVREDYDDEDDDEEDDEDDDEEDDEDDDEEDDEDDDEETADPTKHVPSLKLIIDAPTLETLRLTSFPPGPSCSHSLVDCRGQWVEPTTGAVREVSAKSLAEFIRHHLRFPYAPPIAIVLADDGVAFYEGFVKGQDELMPFLVRHGDGDT